MDLPKVIATGEQTSNIAGEVMDEKSFKPINAEVMKKERLNFRRRKKPLVPKGPKICITVHFYENAGDVTSDQTVIINCGTGEQSIRWLGTAASTRLLQKSKARGVPRQREKKLKLAGNLLPKNVNFTPRGNELGDSTLSLEHDPRASIPPMMKIKDVLKDGAHVRLGIQSSIKTTPALNPTSCQFERSSWTESAFSKKKSPVKKSAVVSSPGGDVQMTGGDV
jgi:hypothetical protein